MKNDLATSVAIAIVGVLIAYFVTNMFMGEMEEVSFKVLNSTLNATVSDPDPEVFNPKSLNPTVEVYVGDCDNYDFYGNCLDEVNK